MLKVFVSHSKKDYALAKSLKSILEDSERIEEAFIFEEKKRYGIQIDQKIAQEIDASDVLVAIITKEAIESASVNQELGYAQAMKISKIPMIEKGAELGVFNYGTENIHFTKKSFNKACIETKNHITKLSPRKKITKDEEAFVQKSAQYRNTIRYELLNFLESVQVYLIRKVDHRQLDFELRQKTSFDHLENFASDKSTIQKLFKIEYRSFLKVYDDFQFLEKGLKNAKRFPHLELFPKEQDALLELTERVAENSDSYLNVPEIIKMTIQEHVTDYDLTYDDFIRKYPHLITLKDHPRIYWRELGEVVKAVIKLEKVYVELEKKFGKLAFKDTMGYVV